ncbi:MAG TPA: CZB domain-containing protein [Cytophagaceae bacterium]|jgi:hypothetical protein
MIKKLLNFEEARARHIEFKSKLKSILNGSVIDETPVLSHYECGVGKWIYNYAMEELGHIYEMHELERVHASIHICARELVALYKSGKKDVALDRYAEIEVIAKKLNELLNVIESKINNQDLSFSVNAGNS